MGFIITAASCGEGSSTTTTETLDPDPVQNTEAAPCENGFAGIYPCQNYDLVSKIALTDMSGSSGNDCWGWTDPSNGKEYGMMCTNTGVNFIDISDAEAPRIVGFLPARTSANEWRDVKTYGNYAFVVSEAINHGMQVFDLTRLRNIGIGDPSVTFTADANYTGFGNAHNIIINETSGYAYALGSSTFNGGPHFIDISNPLAPLGAGGYSTDAYSHDAQVVTYNGPDTDYTGREILIGSNENEVVIVDVTDKSSPSRISKIAYNNIGYAHQGWFTDDMRFFILGDELDERDFGGNTRNIIFDFNDLDNPTLHTTYSGPTLAIDHNGYVNGDTFYLANYSAGVRFIDISSISSGIMTEVGYFDTFPTNNSASFNGAWNVYPYFASGNIIVSDINSGFFVLKKSQ